MPEEFAAASVAHIFPRRHKHVRETIEVMLHFAPSLESPTRRNLHKFHLARRPFARKVVEKCAHGVERQRGLEQLGELRGRHRLPGHEECGFKYGLGFGNIGHGRQLGRHSRQAASASSENGVSPRSFA
jgi:hypothetical protein